MHEGHSSCGGYSTGVECSETFLEWTPARAAVIQKSEEPVEILSKRSYKFLSSFIWCWQYGTMCETRKGSPAKGWSA